MYNDYKMDNRFGGGFMKKLLVFILAIALCSLSLFALSEEAQSLVGSWRASRLSGEEGDFDLTGAAAANMGVLMTLSADDSFTMTAYSGSEVRTYSGKYDLAAGGYLLLYAGGVTSPGQYHFEENALILTEATARQETEIRFEKCDNVGILGYWRSVSIDTGSGEIDIDGSRNIGISLYFRADGSCTGIIMSGGKTNVRDMTYLAGSEAITLIEPNSLSTFLYTVEGDTMVCVFFTADGSASNVYRLVR